MKSIQGTSSTYKRGCMGLTDGSKSGFVFDRRHWFAVLHKNTISLRYAVKYLSVHILVLLFIGAY